MKLKKKINLLIDRIDLYSFQLHLLTVMLAEYTMQTKDLEPLNNLIRLIEDAETVIDWFHAHTPIRFNPKKKKFVARGNGRWSIATGLSSELIVGKNTLVKYTKFFSINSTEDLERAYKAVEIKMAELDAQYEADSSVITFLDIEQVPNIGDREKIKAYLKANPVQDSMGKFGIPQSKHRFGIYGMPTLNLWSR
ncbi:hypothetical protein Shewmr4_0138 [Shewanella sp. MR-4]|uniref:hypothetical protein n=1 Tax=Shewanella sp. (strain MR-4) TaxID=60480 RepID=UPI0000DE1BF9|nr:hypothetical protein [Shewanella sp. MR-4]ABI37219.1 hypothetical protein Shewmr4_0138 [Shewanella sp. MR-4]